MCGERFSTDTGVEFGATVTIAYPKFAYNMPANTIKKDVCAECVNKKKVTIVDVGGECPWYLS